MSSIETFENYIDFKKKHKNSTFFAGVIYLFLKLGDDIYVILGRNAKYDNLSAFGGRFEKTDKKIINTSIREFNEETYGVFQIEDDDLYDYIKNKSSIIVKETNAGTVAIFIVMLDQIKTDNSFGYIDRGLLLLKEMTDKAKKEYIIKKDDPKVPKELKENSDIGVFNFEKVCEEISITSDSPIFLKGIFGVKSKLRCATDGTFELIRKKIFQ